MGVQISLWAFLRVKGGSLPNLGTLCHGSAKTAETIEMPFGLNIRVGPGNHVYVLLGGSGPP